MRLIGHLQSEAQASQFSGFLLTQGIDNDVEPEAGGRHGIWVHDDDQLTVALAHFGRYQAEPGHSDFRDGAAAGREVRARQLAEARAVEARALNRADLLQGSSPVLTYAILAGAIVVAVLSRMGAHIEPVLPLFISEYEVVVEGLPWHAGLEEVRSGQVWRLLSPVLLHFGVAHLLMNMLAWMQLGSAIERVFGTRLLLAQVVLIGVASNLGQFILHGPNFGGISGVLFGIFGYAWIRGKYDPGCGVRMPEQAVVMMLIWFGICFTGLLPIANTAHTVGLVMGGAWGYLAARRSPRFGD